jgi:pimeloyl-ACP methyl ester carboxylesterase
MTTRHALETKVHIEEFGSGFPVVLLHGTPTVPAHMRPLAERLGRQFRALLVHLPGYGESPAMEPHELEHSQALVRGALAARGAHQGHAIGFSTGAYRAFALAVQGDVGFKSIVGLGAIADFSHKSTEYLGFAQLLRAGTIDVAATCEELMLSPRGRQDSSCVADIRSWASATTNSSLASELEMFAGAPDLRPALASLNVPLLLRVGGADVGTPPEISREIASLVCHAGLEIVPDVGHALLCEDFEATAAAVERFLLANS